MASSCLCSPVFSHATLTQKALKGMLDLPNYPDPNGRSGFYYNIIFLCVCERDSKGSCGISLIGGFPTRAWDQASVWDGLEIANLFV